MASGTARRGYSLSRDGTLAYLRGLSGGGVLSQLALFDRAGRADTLGILAADIRDPHFSPDGRWAAYVLGEGPTDEHIHTFDLLTGERRQITFEGQSSRPVWSPDGTRLAFAGQRGEDLQDYDLHVKPVDTSGPEQRVWGGEGCQAPSEWPHDTLLMVTTVGGRDQGRVRPLTGDPWSVR